MGLGAGVVLKKREQSGDAAQFPQHKLIEDADAGAILDNELVAGAED